MGLAANLYKKVQLHTYIHIYMCEILVTGTSIYVNEMLLLEFIAGPSP